MSQTSELRGLLGAGFVLELSGAPGSGRREAALRLLSRLGGRALYVDLASTAWRLRARGVEVVSPEDPLALLSTIVSAGHEVVVVDSLPRVFHAFDLEYRARWGLAASTLALAIDRASRGLGTVVINYRGGSRSFGELLLATYYTHRAIARCNGGACTLAFHHPFEAEVPL